MVDSIDMQQRVSTIWDRLYQELLNFVLKKVRDRPTAEDIVQDVFVKVHTKSNQLKESDKIIAWIYRITRNAVADHFRRNAKQVTPVGMDWDSSYHEFNECVAHCLGVLLGRLPAEYRLPLELAELEGLAQYDVAVRLGISYSGARSRVQRARRMLKEKLDELYMIKTDSYGNVISCEDRSPCCCRKC